MVEKLGDIFNLFNQVRQVNFPPPLIEEYIDLEIEAQQLVNIELPSKSHFKKVIKVAVKPVGVIPITQWARSSIKDTDISFLGTVAQIKRKTNSDPSSVAYF